MKDFVFTVKFANGHRIKYTCNAKTYTEAYLKAVEANVVEEGDTVVPHSF